MVNSHKVPYIFFVADDSFCFSHIKSEFERYGSKVSLKDIIEEDINRVIPRLRDAGIEDADGILLDLVWRHLPIRTYPGLYRVLLPLMQERIVKEEVVVGVLTKVDGPEVWALCVIP